jgi:hypothetical protein
MYSQKYNIPLAELKEYMCMVSMKAIKMGLKIPAQFQRDHEREVCHQRHDCCTASSI